MTNWVIGNWKLNPASLQEVRTLVGDIADSLAAQSETTTSCHVMVAPSFVHLSAAHTILHAQKSALKLACQDVAGLAETTGAYTGDVSAAQLVDMGVDWAIIGHSERRQFHHEDNDILLQKLQHCGAQQLGAVFCIGESESEFAAGKTEQVLAQQLTVIEALLQQLPAAALTSLKLIIAYEPVWAIGTGKVPSVDEVAKVHRFIRQQLSSFSHTLEEIPVIYGGSVKPDNAAEFAACADINGVLVGGAALQANDFMAIVDSFC